MTRKFASYKDDTLFLKTHLKDVVELHSDNASIVVSGDYQARVMTSTSTGVNGYSYGWLNYKQIKEGLTHPQFNAVGGEERFWLGPEGGQYGIYFPPGKTFDMQNWKVPAVIDTEAFIKKSESEHQVTYEKKSNVINNSGTNFDIYIQRQIEILSKNNLQNLLNISIPDNVSIVAYQTNNWLKNTGKEQWTKENGLLSIWLLGMFTPTKDTVCFIPFKSVDDVDAKITTNYFGEIPPERLQKTENAILLKCDGTYRSKVGISPLASTPMAASYDFARNILSVIYFTLDQNGVYVNAKWEQQSLPYTGDAINAYNDGRLDDGTQMGPFYELESSSPALELKPGEQLTHQQTTMHFEGSFEQLRLLTLSLMQIDLTDVKTRML